MADKKYYIEFTVGIFVFISLICIGYLTIKLGKMELVGSKYYPIKARFSNITGLKKRKRGEDIWCRSWKG